MPKSLVLGLGNPLSGADAFGPAVLERLRGEPDLPRGVTLEDAHTDLLAHVDRFDAFDEIVLVDAVVGADGPRIAVVAEETFTSWDDRSASAHQLSAVAAVKLFRALRPGAALAHPVITLIAHLVREEDFSRPPGAADVTAGAAAVRHLLGRRPR